MLPEMAPYALTTLALGSFGLAVAQANMRATIDVIWACLAGAFLVICSWDMARAPIGGDPTLHGALRWTFFGLAAVGVPAILLRAVDPMGETH